MRRLRFICTSVFALLVAFVYAQDSLQIKKRNEWKEAASNKGQFYIYFGYNRSVYSNSDIHFTGRDYDVTFYDLKASDRPTKFSFGNYFTPESFTVPQYNVRIGYFITDRFHISFGTDHMKYVINQYQQARISGVVSSNASAHYAGTYLNDTITLSTDVLRFDHTNGLNFMSLDVEYLQPIANIYRKKIWLKWNFGLGGLWVITRTDVKIFEDGVNNDFHLSGYALAAKTGVRIEFWKYIFLAYEVKGGYMTLPDVPINNSAPKHADHNFSFFEYYGMLGLQIPLNKWLKKKK